MHRTPHAGVVRPWKSLLLIVERHETSKCSSRKPVVDITSQRTTPRGSYLFHPTTPSTTTASGPHLVKWEARCSMPNGSRTIGAAISDHLLAPSRQLAMHGIVRKLDVPRRNWGGGVLYVGSPSRAGVCSNFAVAASTVSICQALSSLPADAQHTRRRPSAPHVDNTARS